MDKDNIITVSCGSVSNAVLAACIENDVLPDLKGNFIGTEIIKEAVRRLKKCPEVVS